MRDIVILQLADPADNADGQGFFIFTSARTLNSL
jgi:hypothetical protein